MVINHSFIIKPRLEIVTLKVLNGYRMKNQNNQNGFIPLIITLLVVVGIVIWLVYERVSKAHGY